MKKRILKFATAMAVLVVMMLCGTMTAFAEEVISNIDVSLQTGDTFLVQHKTIEVKSTLSEAYGYADEIPSDDGVSALDLLIALHIDYYNTEDKSVIEQKFTTNAYGAVEMLGQGDGKTGGFTVNGKYVLRDAATMTPATIFETALKSGDSVDFFWYEDANKKDIAAFFSDSGNKADSLEAKAGEDFTVTIEGFAGPLSSESEPVENAMLCSVDASGIATPLFDAEGNSILTDAEGKAVLRLPEGTYTLTVMNGDGETGRRIIMPQCVVTVTAGHTLEKVEAKEPTAAEVGNTEYWYCSGCGKYFRDANAEQEIEKEDTVLAKLPPVIIEGDGATATEGEKKALSFTSNAGYDDFIRVEVDGTACDEGNYTVKSGSTVVTLKEDYVAGLPVGEHTLGIVSEAGTAIARFTVNKKAAETAAEPSTTTKTEAAQTAVTTETTSASAPQTGDSAELQWCVIALVASMCVLAGICVSKKKQN